VGEAERTKIAQADDRRVLLARTKLVVGTLPVSIAFNPTLSVLVAVAMLAPRSPFGPMSPGTIAAMIAVHLASSALAWGVGHRRGEITLENLSRVRLQLLALQAAFSGGWAVTAWLCWVPGNPVNNVFIAMATALVIFAAAFTRAASFKMVAVAVLVQGLGIVPLLAGARTHAGHVMLFTVPFFIAYILLMARGARRRVDAMVQTHLAADDLASALAEANRESLRKRYEAEAANASKTAFLANMSHELRTPLNAILGFSDIIANQSFGEDNVRYAEYARDIHASGAHLLSLINDLLDVAKIDSGKMEIEPAPVDPRRLVENVARLIAPRLAAKKQVLHIAIERDLPMILADERAFKQMLLNLASNAIKFTPEGGEITFGCCLAAEGGITVIVQDNGPGIAAEKLARVFQPFSQIDNRYDREAGGTGLGLALVKGLAELHGGRIWIESEPGQGVKACIYFPATIEPRAASLRA
jgi:two-component system cell cycle sensor histidine kinase PleC